VEDGSKDSVVRREKVVVLTRGTLMDTAMLEASPDAALCLAVAVGDYAAVGENAEGDKVRRCTLNRCNPC
jgi:DNA mismatch repair protein MSH6